MATVAEDLSGFDKFKEIINGSTPAFFDVWAPWCPPCRMMGPIFERLAKQNPEARFYKVDKDEESAIIEFLGVRTLPVFYAYKNGKEVGKVQGPNQAKLQAMVKDAIEDKPAVETPAAEAPASATPAETPVAPPTLVAPEAPAPTPAEPAPAPTPTEPAPAATPAPTISAPAATRKVEDLEDFEKFKEIIASPIPTILDIWAPWCPPCKMMGPIFEKLAAKTPEARFYKIDNDESPEIINFLEARSLPVFFAFKNGEKIGKVQGAFPAKLLDMTLNAVDPNPVPAAPAGAPAPEAFPAPATTVPAPAAAAASPAPPLPGAAATAPVFSMDEDF